jgi:hypothetical protein
LCRGEARGSCHSIWTCRGCWHAKSRTRPSFHNGSHGTTGLMAARLQEKRIVLLWYRLQHPPSLGSHTCQQLAMPLREPLLHIHLRISALCLLLSKLTTREGCAGTFLTGLI